MAKKKQARVLCVDDEPSMLASLKMVLRIGFDVETAESGAAALELMKSSPPVQVVISDLRMPGMDGLEFLRAARDIDGDATRLLLTGQPDMETAIEAVNQGLLFRFLTKPITPKDLFRVTETAVEQHRLVTNEKVLLDQTLLGSIKALNEVVGIVMPEAVGRASRIERQATALGRALRLQPLWPLRIAAMLTQLGYVALPDETRMKIYRGDRLNVEETKLLRSVPQSIEEVLENIPRLEQVRKILVSHTQLADGTAPQLRLGGGELPVEAKILKIVSDYDILRTCDLRPDLCVETMRGRKRWYDTAILNEFAAMLEENLSSAERQGLEIHELVAGMVFAENVTTVDGVLLLARGHEVTKNVLRRLRNHPAGTIRTPISVLAHDLAGVGL